MTFGDLLAKLVEFGWDLVPLVKVRAWQQGVRIKRGKIADEAQPLRPGIHWFWPLFDEIDVVDASLEVADTSVQTLTTADGEHATFQLMLRYKVVDACAIYRQIYEYRQTVLEQAEMAAGAIVATLYAEPTAEPGLGDDEDTDVTVPQESIERLPELVQAHIESRLALWGIQLEEVGWKSLVFARTYRLIVDHASGLSLAS